MITIKYVGATRNPNRSALPATQAGLLRRSARPAAQAPDRPT